MEVSRAIADLEEVRTRLAAVQRFRGLSGGAAFASGFAAIASRSDPSRQRAASDDARPTTPRYVTIWIACLACSLAVNYGAIVLWLVRHWSVRSRVELKTVGMTILPSIVAGGLFTAAFVARGELGLLPGMWCLCYALGLIASRAMAPAGNRPGCRASSPPAEPRCLFAPGSNALAWWAMPITFGLGQIVIGVLVVARRRGGGAMNGGDAPFAYARLERIFHERGRLAVCTCLVANPHGMRFTELQDACAPDGRESQPPPARAGRSRRRRDGARHRTRAPRDDRAHHRRRTAAFPRLHRRIGVGRARRAPTLG